MEELRQHLETLNHGMLPHHPQQQSAAPVATPLAGSDTAAPASVPAPAGPAGSATTPHQISASAATVTPNISSTGGGPPSGVRDGAEASSSSSAAGSGPSPAGGGSQQGIPARVDDAQAVAARSRHVGLGNGPRVNQTAEPEAGRRQEGSLPPQPRQQRSARQAQAAAAGSREGQSQSVALPAVLASTSSTAGMFSGFDT